MAETSLLHQDLAAESVETTKALLVEAVKKANNIHGTNEAGLGV